MSATGTRLSAITKELWNQWLQTRDQWQDSKSAEFQQRYLEELINGVDKAVTVIEQLDKLTQKIKKDCE